MNPGMLGLPGFSPEVAAGPWGNAAIPIRAVCNGTQLVISARSRDGGMLGSNGPAVVMFPNADPSIGDYKPKTIVQPVPPIVIASGSTMGFSNNVTGRLWVLLVDGLSGPCLAVVNCLSSTTATYPLRADGLISTLALSGGASAALQPYAAAATTGRPCIILGYFTWETALATAGTWNANPGICRLYGPGVPLPGTRVQLVPDYRRLTANGTTTMGATSTLPTISTGTGFFSAAITPTSKASVLEHDAFAMFSTNGGNDYVSMALFQDSTTNALAASATGLASATGSTNAFLQHRMQSNTLASTTFSVRAGTTGAATTSLNWSVGSTAQAFGGVASSLYTVTEIMG